jgi:formate dehydrogenase
LYVHPDDAARLGLREGDYADVQTDVATVRVPVRLLDELMPGTVALPHGWGHQHARGLSVAGRTRGVNVNLLAADGPERLERVSGMAHLTGFCVDVRPAAGPFDPQSWSGIDQAANTRANGV